MIEKEATNRDENNDEQPNEMRSRLDRGSSNHMCNLFHKIKEYVKNDEFDSLHLGQIRFANGDYERVLGYGILTKFKKVLHVPDLDAEAVL